jgi:2-haloacid dehalogenase
VWCRHFSGRIASAVLVSPKQQPLGTRHSMPLPALQTTPFALPAAQIATTQHRLRAAISPHRHQPTKRKKMSFRPKYVTFDCYGTLTRFRMDELTREIFADRVPTEKMGQFLADFTAYRFDEVLGDWQPYETVLKNAVRRLCRKWKLQYFDHEAQRYYDAVPTWGPHEDVAAGLSRVAKEIPLVILSNASDDQIHRNVAMLGAPFHRVYTAQMAQAYKPRLKAFEYMLDSLGCNPEDVLHVSSSLRYDLMSADDLGIVNKVYVNRGHGPGNPAYRYVEIKDIGGLPGVVGL